MLQALIIEVIQLIGWHSGDMRVDRASVDHFRDDLFERPGTQQAHVHLEFIV